MFEKIGIFGGEKGILDVLGNLSVGNKNTVIRDKHVDDRPVSVVDNARRFVLEMLQDLD